MWQDFSGSLSHLIGQSSFLAFHFSRWFQCYRTWVKLGCCSGQAQTQDSWTTCTKPSGLVTVKSCMTSHSAEDKAHWLLPGREVGCGDALVEQHKDKRKRERQREREHVDLQIGLLWQSVCRNLRFRSMWLSRSHVHMCCEWVWLHARVSNVFPCLRDLLVRTKGIPLGHHKTAITDYILTRGILYSLIQFNTINNALCAAWCNSQVHSKGTIRPLHSMLSCLL